MLPVGTTKHFKLPYKYLYSVLATAPIAYWRMAEVSGATLVDDSGNARNGSYVGGVTPAARKSRFEVNAPTFAGVNGYCNVQGAGLAGAFGGTAGSVMVWLKVSSSGIWTDGARHEIFRFLADGSNYVFLRKDTTDYLLSLQYKAGGTLVNGTRVVPGAFTDWVCYVLTWSHDNDRVRIYENGILVNSYNTLGDWVGALTTSLIGAASVTPTLVWSGGLSDVAVWARELTAAEVLDLSDCSGMDIPVFAGDSITAGTAATTVANRWMNRVCAAKQFGYFVNWGVAGTTLQNTIQNTVAVIGGATVDNYRDNVVARGTQYRPLWVFILYGLNDIRLNDVAFSAALFGNDLGEIVDLFIAAGTNPYNIVIGSPSYIPVASYALNAPTFNGGSVVDHVAHVAQCAAVAAAKGCRYIDVYQWMIDHGGDTLVSGDGIHPNDAGHLAIANAFLSVIS